MVHVCSIFLIYKETIRLWWPWLQKMCWSTMPTKILLKQSKSDALNFFGWFEIILKLPYRDILQLSRDAAQNYKSSCHRLYKQGKVIAENRSLLLSRRWNITKLFLLLFLKELVVRKCTEIQDELVFKTILGLYSTSLLLFFKSSHSWQ